MDSRAFFDSAIHGGAVANAECDVAARMGEARCSLDVVASDVRESVARRQSAHRAHAAAMH